MKSIKNNFKLYYDIIGKYNIIISALGIILLNFFQIPTVNKEISSSFNLLMTYSNIYYYVFILFIISILCVIIFNNYHKKYYFFIRYENLEDYEKSIYKIIIKIISIIFVFNFIISLIILLLDYNFKFTDSIYIYYSISSWFYCIYYYIRFYLITLIYVFIITKIFVKYKSIKMVTVFFSGYLMILFMFNEINTITNNNVLLKMFTPYYFGIVDYGTLLNESFTFFFYQTLKILMFKYILEYNNKIFNYKLLKLDIYYLVNNKRIYIYLFIYILMNILNYCSTSDANYLLFTFEQDYNYFVSNIMLLCSYFSILSFFYYYMVYTKGFDIAFLTPRVEKRQHKNIKIVVCLIIVIIMRIPIYIFSNCNYVFKDIFIYIVSIVLLYFVSERMK